MRFSIYKRGHDRELLSIGSGLFPPCVIQASSLPCSCNTIKRRLEGQAQGLVCFNDLKDEDAKDSTIQHSSPQYRVPHRLPTPETIMTDVLGVLVIARNGDRSEYYQDPKTYESSYTESTALGAVSHLSMASKFPC